MEQDKLWKALFQLLGGEAQLKTMRQIIIYLLDLVQKPTTSSKDVARIIAADPALSTKVLTVVNSPALGVRHQIVDLTHAISLLGFTQIRDIVLSIQILDKMPKSKELQFIRLWKHAFYCGKVAEIIAKNLSKRIETEAFALGLLHDIGKILLCQSNEKAFNAALNNYKYHGGKILHWQSEKQILGMSHAEIGALATVYWQLPETMYKVIWSHHSPKTDSLKTTEESLAQVVNIADTITWTLDFPSVNTVNPFKHYTIENCVGENLLAPLGLTVGRFKDIVATVKKDISKSETLFDWMKSGSPPTI